MIIKRRKRRGQSMFEFVALIMFILAAFLIFQKYIVRGLTGRWKGVGDSFGQGRIYDPNKTIECAANAFFDGQKVVWYNQICFEEKCTTACLEVTKSKIACEKCIGRTKNKGCRISYCEDEAF